ncbi:hypothetical protein [Leptospira perolatii]|uniref:hypothetical protein n=1 Tax=Leptospira perolatii TaxID=2023191 RepID=UPI000F6357DC|nr:hypothetical protein [Leptospira perolatii]
MEVDRKSAPWFKIQGVDCWVFGGYVKGTPSRETFTLTPDEFLCLPPTEYRPDTPIHVVGSLYVMSVYADTFFRPTLSGGKAGSPELGTERGIVIGDAIVSTGKISLEPREMGVYSPAHIWMGTFPVPDWITKEELTFINDPPAQYFARSTLKVKKSAAAGKCPPEGVRTWENAFSETYFVKKTTSTTQINEILRASIYE